MRMEVRVKEKPKKMNHKICRDCSDELPKYASKLQTVGVYCDEHAALRGVVDPKLKK